MVLTWLLEFLLQCCMHNTYNRKKSKKILLATAEKVVYSCARHVVNEKDKGIYYGEISGNCGITGKGKDN